MGFEIVREDILQQLKITKEDIILPTRKTKFSVGYDISIPSDQVIYNKTTTLLVTGIKCKFPNNWAMEMSLRSSFAIKNNLIMPNANGLIESDYYNNITNDGHIMIAVYNPNDYNIITRNRMYVAQCRFYKFETFGDVVETQREGGFGSTDEV